MSISVTDPTDDTPPVVTGCPTERRATASPGTNSAVVFWTEPTATDDSGATPTRTRSHAPGDSFNVGTASVVYTFSDAAGNVATCIFNVVVESGILQFYYHYIICWVYF